MAKTKIKKGKTPWQDKVLDNMEKADDEVSRQREHDRKRLKELTKDAVEIPKDFKPVSTYSLGESEAESELKRAKARFLNKLSDLMEDLPDSDLGKAIHQQLTKDIRT
jgi:hypothetical protein